MNSNASLGDAQKRNDKFDQPDYTTTPDNFGATIAPGGERDEGQAAPGISDDSSLQANISPDEEKAIAEQSMEKGTAE